MTTTTISASATAGQDRRARVALIVALLALALRRVVTGAVSLAVLVATATLIALVISGSDAILARI